MSSHYDRIEGTSNGSWRPNETTSILKDKEFQKFNKISTERCINESIDDLNGSFERSERLTDASSASFYSQSAFQLKRQMWLKNRNLLIIIAIIIIGIIIFIAILISEPWKT